MSWKNYQKGRKKHVWQNPASSDKLLKIVLYEYHYGAIHPLAQPPVAETDRIPVHVLHSSCDCARFPDG
ncbi:hypothetical protein T03_85 [Trichinella britovi]|uniref:Uncharacterized protein n=1 Tax=Trichinella britovi TaxID=45882 RepID=A0A0V1C6N2_TRIBR|nr:hypothetical protein T03_16179 [Trichinella britovi]KRY44132.1 hypothetical protein T03_17675 [Trichinella britovi]KRY44520.1 hypothetical protein T03_2860 [Trichinella britovi]KRY44728.1 hypothetical protein T03_85 [Trichinella britovi]